MLRDLISERERDLPLSTIGTLIALAEDGKGVISLGAGELDYGPPPGVVRATIRALKEGYTHYSPAPGRTELREALVKKLKKENKIRVNPDQVMVTTGATEGIFMSLLCTVDPGEGVLVPDPGFLAFTPAVELLNGMPLPVRLREEERFAYHTESMERAIVPKKTRVMIINTPANPTGQVMTKKQLEEVADFAVENELLILSDEAYEKFVYGVEHVSIGSLNGMDDQVVTLQSFSKSFAMPGYRVGYATGPLPLIRAMSKIHVFTSICAPTLSQRAAVQALKETAATARMVRAYDKRRTHMVKRVQEISGLSCLEPNGTFYVFVNIKELGMTSLRFSELLLKKAKVAVVPGTEFGRGGEGYIRLSYATAPKQVDVALDRIERVVKRLK